MAAPKKTGSAQARKPKKKLNNGLDPSVVGKATQFKPGHSGNPAGPAPGYKHISTHIQELLEDDEFEAWIPDSREGIKEYKGRPMKAILRAMAIRAMAGDVRAFDVLAKFGYGSKDTLEVTGPGGGPMLALVRFMDGRPDSHDSSTG